MGIDIESQHPPMAFMLSWITSLLLTSYKPFSHLPHITRQSQSFHAVKWHISCGVLPYFIR